MKIGLAARAGATVVALLVAAAGTVGALFYHGGRDALVKTTLERLNDVLSQKRKLFESHFEQLRRDALMLADTAPIHGMARAARAGGIDPLEGSNLDKWRARQAHNFVALLRAKPEYRQARVIGVADGGRELVRVDRGTGEPVIAADAALQRKGDRPYFRAALLRPSKTVYLSPVELNQEHGRVESPHQPVLRAAAPLYDDAGAAFGALIINMDFAALIRTVLGEERASELHWYITDETGNFLYHPEPARRFGRDLGTPYRLQDELPAFASFYAPQQASSPAWSIFQHSDRRTVGYFQSVRFDPHHPERFIGIAVTVPFDAAVAGVDAVRDDALVLALISLVAMGALAFRLTQGAARDLTRITLAAESVANVRDLPPAPLPVSAPGEIGVLARAFETMQRQIDARTEALRASEAQFRLLAEHGTDVISRLDTELTLRYISPACTAVIGYRPDELLHRNALELAHPEEIPMLEQLRQTLLHSGNSDTVVHRLLHRDGNFRWMESAARVTRDSGGAPTGFIISTRDISDRKAAEFQLLAYRDHLQEIVAERTRDLVAACDAAQAAEHAMAAFLANMSHELRTPLHGILNFARFGLKKFDSAGRDKLLGYFGEIHASGEHLLALVNDLLDMSRLRAGKMSYFFETRDYRALVRRIGHELAPMAEERGQRIEVDVAPTVTTLRCDGTRIEQVLRNLLANALKFSTRDSVIEVSVDVVDGAVVTRVADRGPGIPDAELEAVFDAFAQSSRTRTNAGGTGLGLAICREIVEAGHGGRITAANRDGGGTVVSFTLPLQ